MKKSELRQIIREELNNVLERSHSEVETGKQEGDIWTVKSHRSGKTYYGSKNHQGKIKYFSDSNAARKWSLTYGITH
jgi:hypothetical protein